MGINLLQVLAAEYSLFTGWSGGSCSGIGDCTLSIAGSTAVTATFDVDVTHSVRLERLSTFTPYSSLQTAYAAAINGDIINGWSITYPENLLLNGAKSITLKGGYNQSYSSVIGSSVILGGITLASGTAIIDGIAIR